MVAVTPVQVINLGQIILYNLLNIQPQQLCDRLSLRSCLSLAQETVACFFFLRVCSFSRCLVRFAACFAACSASACCW